MRIADLVVSNGIRHASAFERNRIVILHGLYRGPFSFPQNRHHFAQSDVRYHRHVSTGANFCQAISDNICSVCPPASRYLKITFLWFTGPVCFP